MSEAEKLVKKAGGKLIKVNTHKVYLYKGEIINIHCGSKAKDWELPHVRRTLRRLEKV